MTSSRLSSMSVKPLRILIVEDDPYICTLYRHLLPSSFELDMVTGYEAALAAAAAARFDVLLLDINLGRAHTGLDVLEALRCRPGYEAVPAIACTAYAQRGDREHFLARGFDAYVPKPFSRDTLVAAIEGVVWRCGTSSPRSPLPAPCGVA